MKNKVLQEEQLTKAFELGFKYESEFHGCGQCVVAAACEALDIFDSQVFNAATGFCAGVGLNIDNTCSAFGGGVLVLGMIYARKRENFGGDRDNKYYNYELTQKLQERFDKEYGSTMCRRIHEKLYGRGYDMRLKEEREAFEAIGGHGEHGCSRVVANAAQWVVEILTQTAAYNTDTLK